MPEVVVIGRVGIDFPADRPGVALEDVSTLQRGVGGFGGNVGTGLARLGVATSVVATVGDDGHGRLARRLLAAEGVDVEAVRIAQGLRTALAFYEAWPPDRFPVTFYPSSAYWALEPGQIAGSGLASAAVLLVSATALAAEPSRSLVLEALAAAHGMGHPRTVLDLDWRPTLWADPAEAPGVVAGALEAAEVVIGSDLEFRAVGVEPTAVVSGERAVYLKLGERGARYLDRETTLDAPSIPVETVCGIGSGDAFAAAVVEGLVRGLEPAETLRRGNAAGAIVATRMTCSQAMPTQAEIASLLEASATAAWALVKPGARP